VFSVAGKTAAAACGELRCGVAMCGRGTKHPLNLVFRGKKAIKSLMHLQLLLPFQKFSY
jgi:hypothetical protein